MTVSRPRIRRFIRFFLSINQPVCCIHQTLTFKATKPNQSKNALKRLLDNLHKRWKMGSLYLMESQQRGTDHFHVLFFFFNKNDFPFSPSQMEMQVGRTIRKAWANAQNNRIHPKANRARVVKPNIGYLLKKIEPLKSGTPSKRTPLLWNIWNQKLFDQHRHKVSSDEEKTAFDQYLPVVRKRKTPRKYFSKSDLKGLKDTVKNTLQQTGSGPTWEEFKKKQTGRQKRVSDADYILFENGCAPWQSKGRKLLLSSNDPDVL